MSKSMDQRGQEDLCRVRGATHRHSNVAPGHGIPPGRVHHSLGSEAVAAESDMTNVAEPQRDEVVAHNLDLGRCEENCEADKGHEQIEVAQLQGQDDAVWRDGKRHLLRDLFRGEPGRIADGAEETRQAVDG